MGLEEENKKLKEEKEKLEAKILRLQSSEEGLEKKLQEENKKLEDPPVKQDTKNRKGNRKIVRTEYSANHAVFKIPDGLDLEDSSVVEWWNVKYGTLRIKYVGKDKPEEIEWEWDPEPDYKWGEDEIIDADDCDIEYSEDEEEKKDHSGGWSPTSSPEPKQ